MQKQLTFENIQISPTLDGIFHLIGIDTIHFVCTHQQVTTPKGTAQKEIGLRNICGILHYMYYLGSKCIRYTTKYLQRLRCSCYAFLFTIMDRDMTKLISLS